MNGSIKQVARGAQEPASSAGTEGRRAPRPPSYGDPYDPKTGQCAVCRVVHQVRAECQERHRIWSHFDERKMHWLKGGARPGAMVCKDCCIGALGGHRCIWWDLCWNI